VNKLNTGITALVLLLLTALLPAGARAQVDAQYTQYWAVPGYYNPSAIGNSDYIHIVAGSRAQWVGIKHAPLSFVALGDMPFKLLGKRLATGAVIQQHSMGLYSGLNAGAQLAFKQKLFKGTLSVGLQVGLVTESFKGSKIVMPTGDNAHEANDDAIPKTDVSGNAFDMNAGIYYQHKYFWAGASVTHITQPSVELKSEGNEEDIYEFQQGRTYYFMAGGNIPIKNTLFELQPSVMAKTNTKVFQGEVTLRARYNKFISGGVGYRYKDAVSIMVGANFKNFFLGYSYDYPVSAISKATTGSHEVFINYNVKLDLGDKNKNKHKSIRIM